MLPSNRCGRTSRPRWAKRKSNLFRMDRNGVFVQSISQASKQANNESREGEKKDRLVFGNQEL